jgi:hypothetical protein
LRSPIEFVEKVYRDVEDFLSTKNKAAKRFRDFVGQFKGVEIKGFKFPTELTSHWKTLLENMIADLHEHQEGTLLFQWDEMPMMVENIKQDHGEKAAMELLDTLRALRHTYPRIRMIYAGSIGLHHVVTTLKRAGYANSPINDMKIIEVPPLTEGDARLLVMRLMAGEDLRVRDNEQIATCIAQAADCVPFYVHHIVDRLVGYDGEVDEKAVEKAVSGCLCDAQDAWDMGHYRKRIDTYYPEKERPVALTLLDTLADSELLTLEEWLNLLASKVEPFERESALAVVQALKQDHYVVQEEEGRCRFYLPLIRRWWRMSRRL